MSCFKSHQEENRVRRTCAVNELVFFFSSSSGAFLRPSSSCRCTFPSGLFLSFFLFFLVYICVDVCITRLLSSSFGTDVYKENWVKDGSSEIR